MRELAGKRKLAASDITMVENKIKKDLRHGSNSRKKTQSMENKLVAKTISNADIVLPNATSPRRFMKEHKI